MIRPSSETSLRLSFPHSANYCAFQKNVNGTDTTALLFFVVTGKQKTPRGGRAGEDPAHPFFSSGPRAVLRNRFLPLNGRRLLFFPVQPILQNPLHEEYRCALFSRGINVPSWQRLRPIYGMKAFHRSGMGSRFEVPRTSNFFSGLEGLLCRTIIVDSSAGAERHRDGGSYEFIFDRRAVRGGFCMRPGLLYVPAGRDSGLASRQGERSRADAIS